LLLQQLNKVKGIKHYNKTERSDNWEAGDS
jgi:hypothetical protein